MEHKRIKVRLTKNSPYSDYGYYEKGDIGYIDGYVNDSAVIILENGKFAKSDLGWIEVVNEEDENVNSEPSETDDERIRKALIEYLRTLPNHFSHNGSLVTDWLAWLEKQGEQKVIIPKFRVGDVIRYDEDGEINRVVEIVEEGYKLEHGTHILYFQSQDHWELVKQKPAEWSEEDEKMLDDIIDFFKNRTVKLQHDLSLYASWLKAIKDRVQPQPKQEWSDEDKKHIMSIKSTIEHCKIQYPNASVVVEAYNSDLIWLSRLQPQWKPSDEQIIALKQAKTDACGKPYFNALCSLYIKLKGY